MTVAWPLFRLRLATARLELRPVTDGDIDELLTVARAGIHEPGEMPFLRPWTDVPPDALAWDFCRYFWGQRASWSPESWRLPFTVRVAGRAVGVQQIQADRFGELRAVDTSSWLGREHHGSGVGTEMRAAVLDFAFHGLGAARARSTALATNPGSIRISEKLGYRRNGDEIELVRGRPVANLRFAVDREAWLERGRVTHVHGLAGLERLFGAGAGAEAAAAGDGAALTGAGAAPWLAAAGLR
jgi:RimJ/RimL family protein N-acetyltransferase